MTPADPLTVLLDRASRGVPLTSDEATALRAAVHQLRQRAAGSERQYELAMEGWNREADAQDQRTARYRAAWQSARRRARLIPEAGQEIHDGTRWRPALQAYSVLRARLARVEQQLADPALRARYYAEASTLLAGAERGPQDDYGIETALDLLAGTRCPRNRRGEGHKFQRPGSSCAYCGRAEP